MPCTQDTQSPHSHIQTAHDTCTHTTCNVGHMHTVFTAQNICTPILYIQPTCISVLHRPNTVCTHSKTTRDSTLTQHSHGLFIQQLPTSLQPVRREPAVTGGGAPHHLARCCGLLVPGNLVPLYRVDLCLSFLIDLVAV